MTARLQTLCSLIEKTESFIDVGCDHGYAVQYVYDNKLADRIAACDISAASLRKAENLLGKADGVRFLCTDGRTAAVGYETVLISGLGGLQILSVIKNCTPRTFILSPQSHAREVRRSLLEFDYDIVYDRVICDGKYYDVIKAVRGGGKARLKTVTQTELSYGMYAREKNPALKARTERMLHTVRQYPATEENVRKIIEMQEVLSWQLQ